MKEKFSLLDKDKKTYNHVKKYFIAMIKEKDLNYVDIVIQKDELSNHLKQYCKEHDREEESNWVCKNAHPLRIYLNSLKEIAFFAFMDSRIHCHNDFSYDLFCKIIDIYDSKKQLIIESIRVEE